MVLWIFFSSCEKEVPDHDIDAEIQSLMSSYNLPSVSACVVKGNDVVWQNFFGYANVSQKIPATSETVYHVASISKLMVVTALMQLVEKGNLDLDHDINYYLPVEIRNPYFPETSITPRMLLTHTAGIAWPQTYQEAGALWQHFPPDEAPSPSEWVPQFLHPDGEYYNPSIWKSTKPGSFELYSNIGINVAAYLVEQISGTNFRQYCREAIFLPLGMEQTSYNYSDLMEDNIAKLYRDNFSIAPFFDDRLSASGGLKMSVNDLSLFLMAYLNYGELNGISILDKESVAEVLELQNPVSGVCLTWRQSIGDWFGHTGGMEGAATATDIHPADQVALIVFCNLHNGVVYPGHEIYGLVRQKANEFRK